MSNADPIDEIIDKFEINLSYRASNEESFFRYVFMYI